MGQECCDDVFTWGTTALPIVFPFILQTYLVLLLLYCGIESNFVANIS